MNFKSLLAYEKGGVMADGIFEISTYFSKGKPTFYPIELKNNSRSVFANIAGNHQKKQPRKFEVNANPY